MRQASVKPRAAGTEPGAVDTRLPNATVLRRALASDEGMRGHLRELCLSALKIEGAEHVGVTVLSGDQPDNIAHSDEVAFEVDRIRAATRQGPQAHDFSIDGIVLVEDLGTETRWPAFTAAVLERTPVRSMLSVLMFAQAEDFGTLNLYAGQPQAFPWDHHAFRALVATHFAVTARAAYERDRAEKLEMGLASNRRIGTAVGILMAHHKVTEEAAFHRLRSASQHLNRKLRDIADEVVLTGHLPTERTVGRTARRPAGSVDQPGVDEGAGIEVGDLLGEVE